MTLGNARTGIPSAGPNVWSTATHQYVVYVRRDWGITVARRSLTSSTWATFNLNNISGDPMSSVNDYDNHYSLAMCVTHDNGAERIHVVGNNHAVGYATDPTYPESRRYVHCLASSFQTAGSWATGTAGTNPPDSVSGANITTYNFFNSLSDGTVIWFCDQQESSSSVGRDWIMFKRGPTATAWTAYGGNPSSSDPTIMQTNALHVSGQPADNDTNPTEPKRCYLMGHYVDRNDRIHVFGTFRDADGFGQAMKDPFYMYSDATPGNISSVGAVWKSVTGTTIPMPITRPKAYTYGAIIPVPNTSSTFTTATGDQTLPRASIAVRSTAGFTPTDGFLWVEQVRQGSPAATVPWSVFVTYDSVDGTHFLGTNNGGNGGPSPVGTIPNGATIRPSSASTVSGGMAVDSQGRPHILVAWDPPSGSGLPRHYWWNGTAWQSEATFFGGVHPVPAGPIAGQLNLTNINNQLWFVGVGNGRIRVTNAEGSTNATLGFDVADRPSTAGTLPVLLYGGDHYYPWNDQQLAIDQNVISVVVTNGDIPIEYSYGNTARFR